MAETDYSGNASPFVSSDTANADDLPYFARKLLWQRLLGWAVFPLMGLSLVIAMRFVGGYSIRNMKEIRRQFQEIVSEHESLLICPNHLTMIDSGIIQWALAHNAFYFFKFRKYPWNIPAVEHFGRNAFLRSITYLNKCIHIDRSGSPQHRAAVLEKVVWLLRRGDPVLIFPEGRRSRTGRLDLETAAYGPGVLAQHVPGTAVLCIYLRGDQQEAKSSLPRKKERFSLSMRLVKPTSNQKGLRAQRELARQVLNELQSLEEEYFREPPRTAGS